ncbi:MAG: DUF5343 domain-containing protein [Dehalococcoidia bacterium]
MIIESKEAAPYAPVHNVLTVIRRLRERGLPDPLTLQELERIGVPAGNAPRTLAALRFLGLVEDEGTRSPAFERLGRASTDEYAETLAEIVRAAYAPVFTVVDPAQDNEIALHDAFRHYHPQAQRSRMVTLFLGVCREAGIIPGGPPRRKAKMRRQTEGRAAERPPAQVVRPKSIESAEAVGQPTITQTEGGPDYRLVSAVMQQLPKDGKWTKARRDKWIEAVAANVDLLIEVIEEANGE